MIKNCRVVCSSAHELRRIWGIRSGFRRADWYKGYRFDPNSDSILTAVDNAHHHRLKTNLLPGYAGVGEPRQEEVVDEQIVRFIDLIERCYLTSDDDEETCGGGGGGGGGLKKMDMGKVFQFLTQDITSAVEFGASFGYLDANRDRDGVIRPAPRAAVGGDLAVGAAVDAEADGCDGDWPLGRHDSGEGCGEVRGGREEGDGLAAAVCREQVD